MSTLLKSLANALQEFEEAKRREMQEDAPKEVDTTLAGWVSRSRVVLLTFVSQYCFRDHGGVRGRKKQHQSHI